MSNGQTPSQTVGPFFAYGLTPDQYEYGSLSSVAGPSLVEHGVPGKQIVVEGCVLDGKGDAIRDALIEVWQADCEGRYAHPADTRARNSNFTGFGRCGTGTDPDGFFRFHTIKPGPVGEGHAPHLAVIVTMRGLLNHLYTRIYFGDDSSIHYKDPVLSQVPTGRQETMVAKRIDDGAVSTYRFDIHMQGPNETVFLDF